LDGFSPEFVERLAESVKNCSLPITFVDIGGIPDEKNKKICRHATHSIILFNDIKKIDDWRRFCSDLGINIIAEIFSDYYGKEDSIEIKDDLFRGTVHYLERGEDVSCRYCVTALAKYLINLTNTRNEV
jgi:CRISPR-associated protein Csx3